MPVQALVMRAVTLSSRSEDLEALSANVIHAMFYRIDVIRKIGQARKVPSSACSKQSVGSL
jgi:hypothetical protein